MGTQFKQSLGIRHLVCGSCNGCEHEMNALSNAVYDITQDGWDIVASPRHADVITVTGPMTQAMRDAARRTIDAAPRPCIVVAIGDCAAGEGPWAGAPFAGAGAGIELQAAVTVRGCPPTPTIIKEGIRQAAQALNEPIRPAAPSQPGTDSEPQQDTRRPIVSTRKDAS
jgi:Ni,Fe-hydrogenase III small subunit